MMPPRQRRRPAVKVRERRGGSLTRRMIVVAAIWIGVLLLIGGYALDRVLSRGIVAEFRPAARICPERDDRRVGNRARRRGAVHPAAGRPAVPRALFGRLFPDQRQGPGNLPVPLAVGPAASRSTTGHNDVELHKRDSFEFAGEPLRILERDVILPGCEGPLALPGRAVARGDRRPDHASFDRP